jgi:uncharacterized lipoprotein YehR (DUF1307 family)
MVNLLSHDSCVTHKLTLVCFSLIILVNIKSCVKKIQSKKFKFLLLCHYYNENIVINFYR